MIFDFIKTDSFINFLYWIVRIPQKIIVVNSWVIQNKNTVIHNNFGDDINVYLIRELTRRPVVVYFNLWRKFFDYTNYMCIGSIIEGMTNSHTIIWGAGAMYGGNCKLSAKPKKVLCVRGEKTRNYLLAKGVTCPEVFGDPAILLPIIYKPIHTKKYKLGIIPHVIEQEHPLIINLKSRELCDVCIIDFKNYCDWHSVIDIICSCERILSSSLHGLIISNAYGIPNKWMKLSDKIFGGYFKFLDYFSAISKTVEEPVDLSGKTSIPIEELLDYSYKTYNIKKNVHDLIESCPFLSAKKKKIYTQSISAVYHDNF